MIMKMTPVLTSALGEGVINKAHAHDLRSNRKICFSVLTSRKHLSTQVTPDFHLKYSTNGGNLGSESK